MASYRRGDEVWVVERRGRAVWWRSGEEGARGRVGHREYASEALAETAMHDEQDARLADRWQLIDAMAQIAGPVLRTRKATASPKLLPRDLVPELEERLAQVTNASEVATAFLDAGARPVVHRISGLELAIEPPDCLSFRVTFAEGEGFNHDNYDLETIAVLASTTARLDIEDVVEIDLFQDHAPWKISRMALVADGSGPRSNRNPRWRSVALLPVGNVRVVREA